MTPWLDDGDVRLYHGDALERLREMPSESVQCIVTSPPFWGLRDYGEAGQIGLEETPDEWCAKLVAVMREARRVLRSDGVCWIEVGDTYASGGAGPPGKASTLRGNGHVGGGPQLKALARVDRERPANVKPKDLVGAPWLLAFALRADGWYLRSDTIWARPNPMPESVTDRPTKAHSYVFLLTKSARYFYDADGIRETSIRGGESPGGNRQGVDEFKVNGGWAHGEVPAARNARSVWSIATEPTPFAHFATFPQALVERCIKAGTSEHGACSECGAPWRRVTERDRIAEATPSGNRELGRWSPGESDIGGRTVTRDLGWEPSCGCHEEAAEKGWPMPTKQPCVVLDPFMGSGTTALVARRLGRHAIGIELNAEYLAISATRLQQLSLLTGA